MKKSLFRRGVAMIMVMIVIVFFLTMGIILQVRFKGHQTGSQEVEEHLKADWVAKGLVQLMLLKIKLLPTEFYTFDGVQKSFLQGKNVRDSEVFLSAWYDDYNAVQLSGAKLETGAAQGLTKAFLEAIPDRQLLPSQTKNAAYAGRIRSATLVARETGGYTEDFVRIMTEATCNKRVRQHEELVKIHRFHSSP